MTRSLELCSNEHYVRRSARTRPKSALWRITPKFGAICHSFMFAEPMHAARFDGCTAKL